MEVSGQEPIDPSFHLKTAMGMQRPQEVRSSLLSPKGTVLPKREGAVFTAQDFQQPLAYALKFALNLHQCGWEWSHPCPP